jgi:hypothetical protein
MPKTRQPYDGSKLFRLPSPLRRCPVLPSSPELKKERKFSWTSFRKKKTLNSKRESTRFSLPCRLRAAALPRHARSPSCCRPSGTLGFCSSLLRRLGLFRRLRWLRRLRSQHHRCGWRASGFGPLRRLRHLRRLRSHHHRCGWCSSDVRRLRRRHQLGRLRRLRNRYRRWRFPCLRKKSQFSHSA